MLNEIHARINIHVWYYTVINTHYGTLQPNVYVNTLNNNCEWHQKQFHLDDLNWKDEYVDK